MKDIIADESKKRFKIEDDDPKKSGILITESWLQERAYQTSLPFK